jgi:hypothetical protein
VLVETLVDHTLITHFSAVVIDDVRRLGSNDRLSNCTSLPTARVTIDEHDLGVLTGTVLVACQESLQGVQLFFSVDYGALVGWLQILCQLLT